MQIYEVIEAAGGIAYVRIVFPEPQRRDAAPRCFRPIHLLVLEGMWMVDPIRGEGWLLSAEVVCSMGSGHIAGSVHLWVPERIDSEPQLIEAVEQRIAEFYGNPVVSN